MCTGYVSRGMWQVCWGRVKRILIMAEIGKKVGKLAKMLESTIVICIYLVYNCDKKITEGKKHVLGMFMRNGDTPKLKA